LSRKFQENLTQKTGLSLVPVHKCPFPTIFQVRLKPGTRREGRSPEKTRVP